MFGEEAPGEAVERGQRGEVDVGAGGIGTLATDGVSIVASHVLESAAEAVAELGGRPFGERDGGDLLDGDTLVDHKGDHPPDQCRGLARPGARLHEEVLVERAADSVAVDLVAGRRAGHRSSSSSWLRRLQLVVM